MAEAIALEGMRLVQEYLPRATANGQDVEARQQMLVASKHGRSWHSSVAWRGAIQCGVALPWARS